jgi:nicotinamidase-related amidase
MCVDATTRAAADPGFTCQIAQDGCATRDLTLNGQTVMARDVQIAFLAALNGIYGRVLAADSVIAELQKS